MPMANIYDKVPIKVQRKSGFDKSFQNLFTGKVGTIIPILTDELIPNTTVNLKMAITTQLPPLASDTFMRVKQKYAAFFVPSRLLVGGYEKWLTGVDDVRSSVGGYKICLPSYILDTTQGKECIAPGSLADYLGVKLPAYTDASGDYPNLTVSAMPFLAYHRIYNDWFRNSLVQRDIYGDSTVGLGTNYDNVSSSPYVTFISSSSSEFFSFNSKSIDEAHSDAFVDGVHLWQLRQANFGSDLYTSCTPQPQNGTAQAVSMTVSNNATNFTISALRAANSMQQFLERNNLAGNRFVDYVKAQYGANLNDAIAQRPILLGSGAFDVYSKGVYQTAMGTSDSDNTTSPFYSTPAAKFGSAYVDGSDLIIKGFTAQEPGYLMVVTWLAPKVTYSTGIDPMFMRYLGVGKQSDMANPILQNVGNEPVYKKQLSATAVLNNDTGVFGYNDRYCNWKDKQDEVHGILRDGSSLQSFALQRTWNATVAAPEISTSFLQIPTNYLDQVGAVDTDMSHYGYWCDTFFDYKVSMPLARYSIPSLQDPAYEHGEDVMIDKSGKQLT